MKSDKEKTEEKQIINARNRGITKYLKVKKKGILWLIIQTNIYN
jgi:uncharacterized protein with HEPN domain